MRIYAYTAQQFGPRSLSNLTELIHDQPIEQRSYGGDAYLRLEDRRQDGDFLLLDFTKRRLGHGPGRYSRRQRLAPFDLGAEDGFGEDTAMVVHLPTNSLAVQYNHHGPKINRIEQYLYAADLGFGLGPRIEGVQDADRCGFRFGAVLTRDAIDRLRRFGLYRSVEFAISVPGVQPGDLESGRSLGAALSNPLPGGVENIRMRFSATTNKDSHLDSDATSNFINGLMRLGMGVTHAVVTGKTTAEDPTEEVDLVSDRVQHTANLEVGTGGRYTDMDRWRALCDAWTAWRDAGLLPI